MHFTFAALSISLLVSLARSHCAITGVQGANGVTAAAFGVTGNLARPSQVSTTPVREAVDDAKRLLESYERHPRLRNCQRQGVCVRSYRCQRCQ